MTSRARDSLLHHVRARAPRPALVAHERALTFAQLDDESAALAAAWAERGVGRGDRVVLFAHNHWRVVVAVVAAHKLGAVLVPANPGYGRDELGHMLADCAPRLVVCDDAGVATVQACGAVPTSLAWSAGGGLVDVAVDDDELCLLIYTSGTTGRAKGCMLSFANVEAGVRALSGLWQIDERDTVVHALPLFHVHGLCVALHGALLRGACTRLVEKFSPDAVVDGVRAGGTVFMGVPTMYARLADHLDAHAQDGAVLSRARLYCAGSAALSPQLLERFAGHTGHVIVERYGMSETLITLSNPLAPKERRKPGAVGHPIPGVSIRVVDEGKDVAAGERGELWVRGAQVMRGYWGRAEETAKSFDQGWFKTGDLVSRDADDGAVRIVGRLSTDILKVGGYKLSAREIEEALCRLPFVKEAAVIGLPDEEWGQRVVACVVVQGEAPSPLLPALQTIELHAAKKPRGVLVVDALPRNAMGKVQKHVLVERARTEAVG